MNVEDFLDGDFCDVGCRVVLHDGTDEYVWVTGASFGREPVLWGQRCTDASKTEWSRPVSEVANVEELSTEEFRLETGWKGPL